MTAASLLCVFAVLPVTAQADDFDFSHLDASWINTQPHGAPNNHGAQLDLSYALSDGAFMYWGANNTDLAGATLRRYDFGVGIHTWGDPDYSFFTTVGWNHLGTTPDAAAGRQDHGFGLSGGVRLRPADDWELYALARYEHNDLLQTRSSGEVGLWYTLTARFALGASVNGNSVETDYLLGLRWYY